MLARTLLLPSAPMALLGPLLLLLAATPAHKPSHPARTTHVAAHSAKPSKAAHPSSADEAAYKQFQAVVADASPSEKIEAWEAFLKKHPHSYYVGQVKKVLAQLKAPPRKATVSPVPAEPALMAHAAPSPTASATPDSELAFLNDSSTPRREVASAAPASSPPFPPPSSSASDPLFPPSSPSPTPSGTGEELAAPAPTATPLPTPFLDAAPPPALAESSDRVARTPRPAPAWAGHSGRTQLTAFGGLAPDGHYVQSNLTGVGISRRFGRIWELGVNVISAQPQETALLKSLRAAGTPPPVIDKPNFYVGGQVSANVLSAIDPISGSLSQKNDIYVVAEGGVVSANLEVCQPSGSCPSGPSMLSGVNFFYGSAGVGHRFYFTPWLAFHGEVRGIMVMERINGVTTPRSDLQFMLGPVVSF